MKKNILTGKKARKEISKGIDVLYNTIKETIGPRGKNVIINKGYGTPLITNDGATIAKEIYSLDPFSDTGMDILKEATLKTNNIAGDGTTTATILTKSILKYGQKKKNANSISLRESLKEIGKEINIYLDSISKKVSSSDDIYKVAKISSGEDKIADILSKLYEKVSLDGVIIDSSEMVETSYDITNGISLASGYVSPYMITDTNKMEVFLNNPYILLYDGSLDKVSWIVKTLEKVKEKNASILIIAKDYSKDAISTLAYNKMNNILNIAAIKIPNFGEMTNDLFKDLSLLLNAKLNQNVKDLESLKELDSLGKASRIKISKDTTYIVRKDVKSKTKEINEVKKSLLKKLEKEQDEYTKKRYMKRINNLEGKTGIIYVGASTKVELEDKRLRLEDALNASITASKEGILPGGGIAYVLASKYLKETENVLKTRYKEVLKIKQDMCKNVDKVKKQEQEEEKTHTKKENNKKDKEKQDKLTVLLDSIVHLDVSEIKEKYKVKKEAIEILKQALIEPFKQIVLNSGKNPKKILKEIEEIKKQKIKQGKTENDLINYGFDALNLRITDLYDKGIIDSNKVLKVALENSISVASMILTTESVIVRFTDYEEE